MTTIKLMHSCLKAPETGFLSDQTFGDLPTDEVTKRGWVGGWVGVVMLGGSSRGGESC